MNDRTGQQFGEYRLIRLIGSGGSSDVYLGEHTLSKTSGAVKILHTQLVSNEDVKNFVNEVRSLFRLIHPNILQILDFGFQSDFPYLVMYYAPNGTLAQRHPRGSIAPLSNIVSYVNQVASALQFAHDQRIIHRDIKPQNMLIGLNNEILISDFGIATPASDSSNQKTGDAAGTPHYMPPEQLLGKPQLASDQYALGITVYEWLCGEAPFQGTFLDMLSQHLNTPPPPLREKLATIPPDVEKVVMKALSKNPKERYAKIKDFADALEQALLLNTADVLTVPTISIDLTQDQPPSGSDEITLRSGSDEFASALLEPGSESFEQIVTPDEFVTRPDEPTLSSIDLEVKAPEQSIAPAISQPIHEALASPVPSTMLFTQTTSPQRDLRDFFIVYIRADRTWAKWVAWELEEAKYSVILPPWYLHSQSDFTLEMQKAAAKAKRIVIILSPDSLNTLNTQPAHVTTLQRETTNDLNKLLPICVREFGRKYRQVLDSIRHIDIAGEDEPTARTILLAGIQDEGVRQTMRPSFPGTKIRRTVDVEPTFPQVPLTMTQSQLTDVTNLSYQTSSTPTPTPTSPSSVQSIEIFFSYSHRDKKLRDELEKYMSHLKRHPSIRAWHDGEIGAGMAWAQEIDQHLNRANVILLLVSQDFIASNYCYDIEMQKAIQRHEAGEARVIPIILHPAFWENTPIGKLQALPTGAKPITQWPKRHQALMDVARGIQREIEKLIGKI